MVKTIDDQLYIGEVCGWSLAGRDRELRVSDSQRYNKINKGDELIGGPEQLLLDADIQCVAVLEDDQILPIRERAKRWVVAGRRRLRPGDSKDQEPTGEDCAVGGTHVRRPRLWRPADSLSPSGTRRFRTL